jgi:hypothetical protein
MSLKFIKQTLKALQKEYGSGSITLSKYAAGAVDFTTATPNMTVTSIVVYGIAMPKTLNTLFLPKSLLDFDKKMREFIINDPACTADWVKEGNYLTYGGERYNIKWSEHVEGYYFNVKATAIGDESPNSQQIVPDQQVSLSETVDVLVETP